MDKPKVAAIIQARMGSSRLPGKILMPLAGKPVLWHIIHRLRKCRTVDVIAIATSDRSGDDALVEFADREGIPLIRGPEENVLLRYAKASEKLDPDVIVRVTGDAPFIDPQTVDTLVETLIQEKAEYCSGEKGIDTIHEGFDPFSRAALGRLLAEASEDPVAIEHVSAYFSAHPDKFHIAYVQIPPAHHFKGARMSVDTPADLKFLETLYDHLDVPAGEADVTQVVRLLRDNPDLLDINSHIYQKKSTDRSISALIRCDSDGELGFGHVIRCLALADELREHHGCGVTFAMISGNLGKAMVQKAGFPLLPTSTEEDEASWLANYIAAENPDMLVLDVRTDLPPGVVRSFRLKGLLVATIDDPSDRRLETDLAFYPPVPQLKELSWDGFPGKVLAGWEWVLLRKEFAEAESVPKQNSPPHILISMGGSDPAGLTLKALREIDEIDRPFVSTVVTGPGFMHTNELNSFFAEARRTYQLRRNVSNMAKLMSQVDIAIISFGVTAYELAALGIPGLYYCLSGDHARSAEAFEQAGIGFSLGVHSHVPDGELANKTYEFLHTDETRSEMSARARSLVDGLGCRRIATRLLSAARKSVQRTMSSS